MINFRLTITGTAPLLMHSSRLANPLDPAAKALKRITSKRTKTDEDHEEIARLEHIGSLYLDPTIGPYVPADNIARALVDSGGLRRFSAKVKRGIFISTDVNPLSYKGPRDAEGLWADANFRHIASVKIGTSRTMRCRPVFSEWRTQADGVLDPNVLDLTDLKQIAESAGQLIGLGDWRPRYGRFMATVEQV